MAIDTFTLGAYFMGGALNLILTVLTIAFIVKIFMAIFNMGKGVVNGFKDGNWPWSGKKPGGGDDGDGDSGSKKKPRDEEDDAIDEFEKGLENPGYLRVWVHNRDRQGVKGAKVSITPGKKKFFSFNRYKRMLSRKGMDTNTDGFFPSKDYLQVPHSIPIKVDVTYLLPKALTYRTEKKGFFHIKKKRRFSPPTQIYTFAPDEKHDFEIELPFSGEPPVGIEPHIEEVIIRDGRINTKWIVKSMTGRP
jgi:hypothetical protein